MVERDFRLTGGKSLIDGIPVFPRSKSLGVASHRDSAASGSADGTLLTYVDFYTMWTACWPGSTSGLDRLLPMSHSVYRVQFGRRCLAAALMRPR